MAMIMTRAMGTAVNIAMAIMDVGMAMEETPMAITAIEVQIMVMDAKTAMLMDVETAMEEIAMTLADMETTDTIRHPFSPG